MSQAVSIGQVDGWIVLSCLFKSFVLLVFFSFFQVWHPNVTLWKGVCLTVCWDCCLQLYKELQAEQGQIDRSSDAFQSIKVPATPFSLCVGERWCVCACMTVRERVWVCRCVCVRERERVCVWERECFCVWERVYAKDRGCVCKRERVRDGVHA